jgi:phage baseplate assembly protein V
MDRTTDLLRRLDNLVRFGTVHAVDHAAVRCRVATGGLVTGWLPWHTARAGETCTWDPPTVGEQVVVLSPSGNTDAGFVLYGFNSDTVAPPSHSADEHVTAYSDGARIAYNHAIGALTATGVKTATVQASVQAIVDTPETLITGNVRIRGTLNVEKLLTYESGMAGFGGKGGSTIISGPVTQRDGPLSSNGVVLDSHVHTGVQGGGSNTGGPV